MPAILKLNVQKWDNYSFFDPTTKLFLTLSNPVATCNRITPVILEAIKNKVIIDIDKKIDLENKCFIDDVITNVVEEEGINNEENIVEEVNEVIDKDVVPVKEEKPKQTKRNVRKKK